MSAAHGGGRPLRVSQELGAVPASPPRWGSAFGFEGTVMSSAGPGNLSLIRKEKVDSSRLPGQEIHFGYICFQKEIAFPPQFPLPTLGLLPLQKFQFTMLGKLQKLGKKKD